MRCLARTSLTWLLAFTGTAALLAASAPNAHAQESVPNDACTTAGLFRQSSGADAANSGYTLFCDGTRWIGMIRYHSTGDLYFSSAGAVALPNGTTAQRPTVPVAGMIRYNSQLDTFEGYVDDGTPAWEDLLSGSGGGAIDNLSDAVKNTTDHNMVLGSEMTTIPAGAAGNIFIGERAGTAPSSNAGDDNIAIGDLALDALTTGHGAIAIGTDAMGSATTCVASVAIGLRALRTLSTCNFPSVAIGADALQASTGDNNVAIGDNALYSNTSGDGNVAIGISALAGNQTSSNSVAVGHLALTLSTGGGNTVIGWNAADANTTGGDNVAMGNEALGGNTDGNRSTAVGTEALLGLTTGGTENIAVGYQAGDNLTTGDRNIIIGYAIDAVSATGDDQLNIGNTIYGNLASDYVGIGNNAPSVALDVTGDIEYTGTIADVSDRRLKKDIQNLMSGQLDKVLKLQGVSFKMIEDAAGRTEFGLIAQDVQEIFPELVQESSGGTLSLNYTGLIAPMIEAMKEQQAQIAEQMAEIDELKAMNAALITRIEALEARQ